MEARLCFLFVSLLMVVVKLSSSHINSQWDDHHLNIFSSINQQDELVITSSQKACSGLKGGCSFHEQEEEEEEEREMVSEARLEARKSISYGALKANNVPCNQRGNSYYNCVKSGKANPYRRSCNRITQHHLLVF
ncbi:Rapid ALkalinization Factor [Dillenia turbinata]|uniref:Rapid ALkalinization Factor n=1 Tax=Dillenia turbinata TaxID=194707 RepID=A0AAN8Z3S1_9MAGN